jgi:hypothetical protein
LVTVASADHSGIFFITASTVDDLDLGLGGGVAKLVGLRAMREDGHRFGLGYTAYRLIGISELAAAAGLPLGFRWWPLAVASGRLPYRHA